MLRKNAAWVVEVKAPDVMVFIGDRKRLGEMRQVLGRLENEHAMAKLFKQHGHARALGRQITGVMCQDVEPIGRIGQQEITQSLVASFRVEAHAVVVLFEEIQVALRQSAQGVECRAIVFDAIDLDVLQGWFGHDYPRIFVPGTRYPSRYHS